MKVIEDIKHGFASPLTVRIQEGLSLGKREHINNDRLVDFKRYIAVIDGVSSRNVVEGTTTLSDKIVEIFINNLKTGMDFNLVLEQTTKQTRQYKEDNNFINCKKDGFVCGVIDKREGKVYILGDITMKLNDFTYDKNPQIDELKSLYRSYLIHRYIKLGYTLDEIEVFDKNKQLETHLLGIEKIGIENGDNNAVNNLVSQDMFIGSECDFGYMVVNGGEHQLEYEVYDINKGDTIILASDGYPKIYNTLKETEDYLNKVLKEDRLCFKTNKQVTGCYKNQNSYDDRTYVKVNVS